MESGRKSISSPFSPLTVPAPYKYFRQVHVSSMTVVMVMRCKVLYHGFVPSQPSGSCRCGRSRIHCPVVKYGK